LLYRIWLQVIDAMVLVKPATVIACVLTQNLHKADTAGDCGGLVVPSRPW